MDDVKIVKITTISFIKKVFKLSLLSVAITGAHNVVKSGDRMIKQVKSVSVDGKPI